MGRRESVEGEGREGRRESGEMGEWEGGRVRKRESEKGGEWEMGEDERV